MTQDFFWADEIALNYYTYLGAKIVEGEPMIGNHEDGFQVLMVMEIKQNGPEP